MDAPGEAAHPVLPLRGHPHHTRPIYRLYVDEVGNSDLAACQDPNHRHLSLTGVMLTLEHARDVLVPAFNEMKRKYFVRDPDQRVVFHRKELVNHTYPFDSLRDEAIRQAFDAEMLALLRAIDFQVITAVIDKAEHQRRYGAWAYHPYHFCVEVLLERYVMELEAKDSRGDVMAECRGKREDRELADAFTRLHAGTDNISADRVSKRVTSRQLKLKKKSDDIAGLQLADLVAHSSFRAMKHQRERLAPPRDFGSKIAEILEETKYRRSAWGGRIDGYGRKWLP